jgi:hypothetical protein
MTGRMHGGGVFSPAPDTLAFFYEAGVVSAGGNDFTWAAQYVRLNRETENIRGVIDRAPDTGFVWNAD